MRNRKFGLLLIMLLVMLFVSGCGSNKVETLKCTKTEESTGISMNEEALMTFKNDNITNVKLTIDALATSDTIKDNWDVFASSLSSQYSNEETDSIKITTNNDEDNYKYTISIEADLTKASKEDLEKYSLEDVLGSNDTLEKVKSDAEADGFQCK